MSSIGIYGAGDTDIIITPPVIRGMVGNAIAHIQKQAYLKQV